MAQLGTLVENIRRNLQEISPNSGNQALFSTDNIKYFVGEAYRKYALMMIYEGDGYFEEVVNLPITGGSPNIDVSGLNPPYFKTSVLRKNTPNGRYPLRTSEKRFTPTDTSQVSSTTYTEYRYRFKGRTTIVLDPVPASNEAASDTTGLQLEYIYEPTFPTATSLDTFEFDANFSIMFDPLIDLYATIAALDSKDGTGAVSDIAVFRDRLARMEESFVNNLTQSEDPDSVRYLGIDYTDGLYFV